MTARLYLVMRNDIPSMNPGKLAAQAAHVANAAVAAARRSKSSKTRKLLKDWEAQTTQDFGTTITLGADFCFIYDNMPKTAHVYDPTYPCEIPVEVADFFDLIDSEGKWSVGVHNGRGTLLRRELVGAFMLTAEKPDILKDLELYP